MKYLQYLQRCGVPRAESHPEPHPSPFKLQALSPCSELGADLLKWITRPRAKIGGEQQQIKIWSPLLNCLPTAHAHIHAINSLTVLCWVLLNPERSGAEVVAFPCQVGVYDPGSTRSISGAHKHNLVSVMWNYWACLVPTCVTPNCKREKKSLTA